MFPRIFPKKGFRPGVILGVAEAQHAFLPLYSDVNNPSLKPSSKTLPVESLSSHRHDHQQHSSIAAAFKSTSTFIPFADHRVLCLRRRQPTLDKIDGITLLCSPAGHHRRRRASARTQFQYSPGRRDAKESFYWFRVFIDRLKKLPSFATSQRSSQRRLLVNLSLNRDSASRPRAFFAILTTRSTTPSVSARSQPFTTQPTSKSTSSLEADPQFTAPAPEKNKNLCFTSISSNGTQVQLSALLPSPLPLGSRAQSSGSFPVVTLSFNLAPGASLGAP